MCCPRSLGDFGYARCFVAEFQEFWLRCPPIATLRKRHVTGGFVQVQDKQAINSYKRNGIRRNSHPKSNFHLLRYQSADRFQSTS